MANLVSILIPAYNAEQWVGATIESALNQTWSKKEIIIVDDGSEDSTLAVARKFESKNVLIISQNNQGATHARNKALEYAQGDFIQYLDADDLLVPNKIAEQMNFSEKDPESSILLSGPFGKFLWRIGKAKFIPNALWQDLDPVEWLIEKFSGQLWLVPACWLVSRKLIATAGPWDQRLTLDDDGEYFCRVVSASKRVIFVRNARCYYRQSVNQLSRRYSDKAMKSLLLSIQLCLTHLISLEESERTKTAARKLLQLMLPIFYPDQTNIINELNLMAIKLGRELDLPVHNWRTKLFAQMFGWKTVKAFRDAPRKIRLYASAKWDELLFRLHDSVAKTDKE